MKWTVKMRNLNLKLAFMVFIVNIFITSVIPAFSDSAIIQNPSNKHWYKRFDTSMGWHTAKAFCERRGGYLATITSQSENNFVWSHLASKANKPGNIWLGATNDKTDTGAYQWITGEVWSFTNWGPGEPSNWEAVPGGSEKYLQFFNAQQEPSGKWNDAGSYNQGEITPDGFRETSTICEWGGKGSWNFYSR
jgi:hypothetical protein